eukprot:TRINITY_DN16022_c0_g1_i1.p1 TRINITY_DN16022_c0_g1~~TRINITY_DN16022_c0_g1_i1.p1  ORF type:complete len:348 (-),score=48.42 TRINITY_DN16022_c0_g1_i1:141-1184(-)
MAISLQSVLLGLVSAVVLHAGAVVVDAAASAATSSETCNAFSSSLAATLRMKTSLLQRSSSLRMSRKLSVPSNIQHRVQDVTESCVPPAHINDTAAQNELSLLSTTGSHALFGGDSHGNLGVMIYSCRTGKKLVFLHIPKAAGTTIENLGVMAHLSWGRFSLPTPVRLPDGHVCMGWHTPPNYIPKPNIYMDSEADVFCVVRDPWKRMLSEYEYLLRDYDNFPHVKDAEPCTKAGINLFVRNSIADMKAGQRWIAGCHMLPQWDYIESAEGQQMCHRVLQLTNLTQEFNQLMSEYGVALRMQPHHHDNSAASRCPDLAAMELEDLYDCLLAQPTRTSLCHAREIETR